MNMFLSENQVTETNYFHVKNAEIRKQKKYKLKTENYDGFRTENYFEFL